MPDFSVLPADAFVVVCAFGVCLSLCIGSFLTVVVGRLPVMLNRDWTTSAREHLGIPLQPQDLERFDLVYPLSRCPSCQSRVTPLLNIPVISWCVLRGRCKTCKAPISAQYPATELGAAAVFLLVAFTIGLTPIGVAWMTFGWLAMAASLIDVKHRILPSQLLLPLMWIGLLEAAVMEPRNLAGRLIACAVVFVVLEVTRLLYDHFRRRCGIGQADPIAFAAVAAWLPPEQVPNLLMIAGALAVVATVAQKIRGREPSVPFGPAIFAAGFYLGLSPL